MKNGSALTKKNPQNRISKIVSNIKGRLTVMRKHFFSLLDRRPLLSFFGFLGLLLVLIIIGNAIRKPKVTVTAEQPPKPVSVYSIGGSPKVTLSAQIEKSGVVNLVSQAGGVVQSINQ